MTRSNNRKKKIIPAEIRFCNRDLSFLVKPFLNYYSVKGKGKVRGLGLYSTEALWLIVLLTPKGVPSFISRGAAHQRLTTTSASEGRNYRWNLANNPVIHVSC
jgi:hypothetical protein